MTTRITEECVHFGQFIPEIAKGLPEDLDFSQAYFFDKRNLVVGWISTSPGRSSGPKLYSDLRTLGCVRTILAGEQWDDPSVKKYVERYTGSWNLVEKVWMYSRTVDRVIGAIEAREKTERRLDKAITELTCNPISNRVGGTR